MIIRRCRRAAPPGLWPASNCLFGPIGMEQLWNRGGATGGKGSGGQKPENGLNERQTVATGCHRLPFGSMVRRGSPVRVRKRAHDESPANVGLSHFQDVRDPAETLAR